MPEPSELTGRFGRLLEQVRAAIADSPKFQEWTGTADAASALSYIYDSYVEADEIQYPFCIVEQGDALSARRAGFDAFSPYASGEVSVVFYCDFDEATYATMREAFRVFRNTVAGKQDAGIENSYDGIMTQVESAFLASITQVVEIRAAKPVIDLPGETGRDTGTEFSWQFTLRFAES